jgi:hypothetical protein
MHTIATMSASASYAYSLYQATVNTLGPRQAYKRACELARLTGTERAALRLALAS